MRTKILAAFVAGGVLVGAGLVTAVIAAPGTAQAQDDTDEIGDRDPTPRVLGLLGDILDRLVGEGTISQDQADAIVDAAEDRVAELGNRRMTLREQLSQSLEDGVVTEDEASELPDDHWIFGDAFDEAWEDGQVTVDELREAAPFHGHHPFRRGFRLGALWDGGGIDQQEYDGLDENHPLKQVDVTEYLADGLITPDEFREVIRDLLGARLGDDA